MSIVEDSPGHTQQIFDGMSSIEKMNKREREEEKGERDRHESNR